jgi:hypothetical protein
MNIGIATASQVDQMWPEITDRIQQGCDMTGGATSSAELWQMCRTGNGFLIVGIEDQSIVFASVWRFETWPTGVVFRCMSMAGTKMETWIAPFTQFVISQARAGGTDRLIAEGRKGWERVIRRMFSQSKVLWQTYEVKI